MGCEQILHEWFTNDSLRDDIATLWSSYVEHHRDVGASTTCLTDIQSSSAQDSKKFDWRP